MLPRYPCRLTEAWACRPAPGLGAGGLLAEQATAAEASVREAVAGLGTLTEIRSRNASTIAVGGSWAGQG